MKPASPPDLAKIRMARQREDSLEAKPQSSRQEAQREEERVERAGKAVQHDNRQVSRQSQRNACPDITVANHRKQAGGFATNACSFTCSLTEAAAHLSERGKFSAAEKRLRETARSLRCTGTGSRRELAVVWNALGIVHKYLGKFRSADRYYHQALRNITHLTQGDSLVADLYHNLGGLEHSRGRFKLAVKYARKGLRLRLLSEASNSTAVGSDLAALAAILDGLGKYEESERLYHQALRIYRSNLGAVHAEIAVVLNNLGALHQAAGRQERAGYFYRSALHMKRRVLGGFHPDLVLIMNNLAALHYAQGRVANARNWLRRALRLARVSLGRLHPVTRTLEFNACCISPSQP